MKPIYLSMNEPFNKDPKISPDHGKLAMPSLHHFAEGGNVIANTIVWQPSEADKQAVLEGKPVYMQSMGPVLPHAVLFTCDDNGDINP